MQEVMNIAERDKIEAILNEISDMRLEMEKLKEKMNAMVSNIEDVEAAIEMELRPNILRIAEGHGDLARWLHIAAKPSEEILMWIAINELEDKVRRMECRNYISDIKS